MKKKSKKSVPRNSFVLAMILRHRNKKMKDRRAPRGGDRNKQSEFKDEE